MTTRPSLSGDRAQSLDLDQYVCAVQGCKRGAELYVYSVPICDWHWSIACDKRKGDNMPDVLRDLLPRRDRHHINTNTTR